LHNLLISVQFRKVECSRVRTPIRVGRYFCERDWPNPSVHICPPSSTPDFGLALQYCSDNAFITPMEISSSNFKVNPHDPHYPLQHGKARKQIRNHFAYFPYNRIVRVSLVICPSPSRSEPIVCPRSSIHMCTSSPPRRWVTQDIQSHCVAPSL